MSSINSIIIPYQGTFEDDVPFAKVGYISFLEGTPLKIKIFKMVPPKNHPVEKQKPSEPNLQFGFKMLIFQCVVSSCLIVTLVSITSYSPLQWVMMQFDY